MVIMDGQSVKTTERGGARGFDAHKRVKGRKRHILVDTLGLLVANKVHYIPTSSSWLNLVERWFAELSGKAVRRGSFASVPDLIQAIFDFIAQWLNSNKGTKSDMGVCPSHSALESYTYVEPPRHHRAVGDLLAGAASIVLRSRACWLMAPTRSVSPVTTTPPEPICTTASKRFAGAISMSLLVPLLEFNPYVKSRFLS